MRFTQVKLYKMPIYDFFKFGRRKKSNLDCNINSIINLSNVLEVSVSENLPKAALSEKEHR